MPPTLTQIRFSIARWLFILSIALLGYCGFVLLLTWRTAVADNMIVPYSNEYHGHGPWRLYLVGRNLLGQAMITPFFAGCAALLSVVIRPSWSAAIPLILSFLTLLVLLGSCYWLID